MNCPVCKKEIEQDRISITIEQHYEKWEYSGLFGGKPESGITPTFQEKTGLYNCNCGCKISVTFQGNTEDFIITGHTWNA
jgi:hypothetical protein